MTKVKDVDNIVADIKKSFAGEALMPLSGGCTADIVGLPSGSLKVDRILGIGGFPKGRIIEIFGSEASGKTTLALQAIAEVHREGGIAAFIDAEHALSKAYARDIGCNLERLLFNQPSCGESAMDLAYAIAIRGGVDLIVIDSVAALTPKKALEGDLTDSDIALHARLMSRGLAKVAAPAAKSGTTIIFVNQTRNKIAAWGNPEEATGGKALKFYSSVRLSVRRVSGIKVGDKIIGNKVAITAVKNKVAPPLESCEVDIIFGKGINICVEIVELGVQCGCITVCDNTARFNDAEGNVVVVSGVVCNDALINYLVSHPQYIPCLHKSILGTANSIAVKADHINNTLDRLFSSGRLVDKKFGRLLLDGKHSFTRKDAAAFLRDNPYILEDS